MNDTLVLKDTIKKEVSDIDYIYDNLFEDDIVSYNSNEFDMGDIS